MIAPTHGLFAVFLNFCFGFPLETAKYLVIGSVLPDIDHPKSFLGRIFYPISIAINKRWGHRNITHSLILWIPIMFLGYKFFKPVYYISLGALSHMFLDMWNITGVGLFKPLTDKIFVMANKKFRMKVGGRSEYIFVLILMIMCYYSYEFYKVKGVRGVVRKVIGSYEMSFDDYERAGLKESYIQGDFREKEGKIKKVKYLIVGELKTEGYLALYDYENDKVIEIPENGKFLKSEVEVTQKEFSTMKISEVLVVKKIEGLAFQKATKKWRKLKEGDYVIGTINYFGKIELGKEGEAVNN